MKAEGEKEWVSLEGTSEVKSESTAPVEGQWTGTHHRKSKIIYRPERMPAAGEFS